MAWKREEKVATLWGILYPSIISPLSFPKLKSLYLIGKELELSGHLVCYHFQYSSHGWAAILQAEDFSHYLPVENLRLEPRGLNPEPYASRACAITLSLLPAVSNYISQCVNSLPDRRYSDEAD